MKGWPFYQTKTLAMIPYMSGTPVYRDGMLSWLYYETKRLGRIEQTFCGETYNHDKFVHYFETLKTAQVLCTVDEEQKIHPVGYSWVSNPRGVDGARSSSPGFCFIKDNIWDCINLARLAVAYAFEDLRMDTLHGVQVVDNREAQIFATRLGFKEVAIVPDYHSIGGKLVAARVMMLRKEDFWPKFLTWREKQEKVS